MVIICVNYLLVRERFRLISSYTVNQVFRTREHNHWYNLYRLEGRMFRARFIKQFPP